MKVSKAQIEAGAEAAAELGKKGMDEFERLMQRAFKPGASKKAEGEFRRLLERKPQPPPASRPEPVLTREPKTSPKTKTKTKPQVGRVEKRGSEDVEYRGIVKIADVARVVRGVFKGEAVKDILGAVPVLGAAIMGKEWLSGTPSKEEQILGLVDAYKLRQTNPRKREKMDVPGRYPNGTKKADIMRRVPVDESVAEAVRRAMKIPPRPEDKPPDSDALRKAAEQAGPATRAGRLVKAVVGKFR